MDALHPDFLGNSDNEVFPAVMIPVDAGSLQFPKGSTLTYNLSQSTIGGKFINQRIVLKSGKSQASGAPIRDFGSFPVAIDCIPKGGTKPRAMCRSTWQHDPAARQILSFVVQKGQPVPRVWGDLDYNLEKTAPGKTAGTD